MGRRRRTAKALRDASLAPYKLVLGTSLKLKTNMCSGKVLVFSKAYLCPGPAGSPQQLPTSGDSTCTRRKILKKHVVWRARNGKLRKPGFQSFPLARNKKAPRVHETQKK